MPTVQSAVLPAGTPESATDFLGFGPVAAAGAAVSLMIFSFGFCEEGVQLLLVVVIAEILVEIVAGLHGGDARLLRAVGAQRRVDLQRGEVRGAESRKRVEGDGEAGFAKVLPREERR